MFTIEDIATAVKEDTPIHELYKKFGGFKIYIPKVMPDYKEKVLEEFNGYNHASLASKYNVSINTIYSIVKKTQTTHQNQATLF